MRKQDFYSLAQTVERYEARRFGGKSGRHVNERELRSVLELLPRGGRLLDLPVGTGRLSLFLAAHGFDCHGVDASEAMLELCRGRGLSQLTRADVFAAPLPEAAFDCAVSLRFFFHFRDVRPVLDNVFRALKPGGSYVFDTFNRSPRAWLPLLPEQSRVHVHPPEQLLPLAKAAGFELVRQLPCYLFSPLAYRFLPLPVVTALDQLEPQLPGAWQARVFWQLRKPALKSARV